MPLRGDHLSRHHAGPEALTGTARTAMADTHVSWHAEALWRQLQPLLPGLSVEVVRATASTNSTLLKRARVRPDAEADSSVIVRRSVESAAFGRRATDWQPCLLVAEQQSAGRGRQGRHWQSQAGASLTFSLGVALATGEWSGLSLAVGVALCEALTPTAGTRVPAAQARLALKWPNDLWLMDSPEAGRKLGGILIESVTVGAQRLAIIGIGLNVRSFDAPQSGTGFAALQELDPSANAPGVLAQVALPLVRAVKQFECEGFAAFAARFETHDLLRGRPVHTIHADALEGVACGVSARGELLVQTASGVKTVASGEVSVRPGARAVSA